MKFELDPQTIKDLEIFDDGRSSKSIFNFYNNTKTIGGSEYLLRIMRNPLTNFETLCERKSAIEYFSKSKLEFDFEASKIELIERYCKLNIAPLKDNVVDAFLKNVSDKLKPSNEYYIIQTGISYLKQLFLYLKAFVNEIDLEKVPLKLQDDFTFIVRFINKNEFVSFLANGGGIKNAQLNKLDHLFRKKYINELRDFIQILYKFDALSSVGKIATTKKLCFPKFINTPEPSLSIKNLYHPLLDNAIPYDFDFTENKNLCFLTGPNMAGKSTFLKAIGLSIYISHIGFPVPAARITTSVFNGIITTINLSDNMYKGYSHFYSEVNRVKETALKITDKKRIFVIFDELFRGTNVKDAFDASSLIIKAFANIKSCKFCISTHITEVAKEIEAYDSIAFNYFDSNLVNNTPVYDYLLKEGVSHERLGMHIVKNEKIVEILESINEN